MTQNIIGLKKELKTYENPTKFSVQKTFASQTANISNFSCLVKAMEK